MPPTDQLESLETPSPEPEQLHFPRDELEKIGHWVRFEILNVQQLSRSSDPNATVLKTICLPIPQNLSEELQVSYNTNAELGNLGSIIIDAVQGDENSPERRLLTDLGAGAALGAVAGALTGDVGRGATMGMIGAATGRLISGETDPRLAIAGGLGAVAAEAVGVLGTLGQSLAASAGVARNPHKVVLFSGADFRQHNFVYDLVPKNYQEAEMIRKIIYNIKYHGSPGLGSGITLPLPTINRTEEGDIDIGFGRNTLQLEDQAAKHFFQYPNTFRISFATIHGPSNATWTSVPLFRLSDCYLTRFSVNYHPANTPSYSRPPPGGKSYPTAVRIEMSFTETEILTREKVEQGF